MLTLRKSIFLRKTFIMKKIITLSFVFLSLAVYSQINIPLSSSKGTLITQTDQKIEYKNLKYEKGKVIYINAQTNQEEFLYDNSLKSIEEADVTAVVTSTKNDTAVKSIIEEPQNVKLTSQKDIKTYLLHANNLEYKRGRNLNNVGTAFVVGGAACFVAGGLSNLSSANKTYSYGEEPKGSPVPLIIGLVGVGAGVVMKLMGHSQMKNAIETYKNADSRKFIPTYYVFNNKNGVGFMMKF